MWLGGWGGRAGKGLGRKTLERIDIVMEGKDAGFRPREIGKYDENCVLGCSGFWGVP